MDSACSYIHDAEQATEETIDQPSSLIYQEVYVTFSRC